MSDTALFPLPIPPVSPIVLITLRFSEGHHIIPTPPKHGQQRDLSLPPEETFEQPVIARAHITVVPAQAGFLPQEPSPTQRGEGRGLLPAATALRKRLPRRKIEPVLSSPKGWGLSPCPFPPTRPLNNRHARGHTIVVPAEAGFLPQEPSPTQRGEGRGLLPAEEQSCPCHTKYEQLLAGVTAQAGGLPG